MTWVKRWAERRRQRARGLFKYHDGTRTRRADPAEIWRKLLNHPEMAFEEMLPLAEQGTMPEREIVIKALCEVFDVKQYDDATQTGLTEWEILQLVGDFDEYLDWLKKNTSPQRMPWQLLVYGQSSSPPSSTPEAPAADTSSSAGSPPTPTGSTPVEPTSSSEPSQTESTPPQPATSP